MTLPRIDDLTKAEALDALTVLQTQHPGMAEALMRHVATRRSAVRSASGRGATYRQAGTHELEAGMTVKSGGRLYQIAGIEPWAGRSRTASVNDSAGNPAGSMIFYLDDTHQVREA